MSGLAQVLADLVLSDPEDDLPDWYVPGSDEPRLAYEALARLGLLSSWTSFGPDCLTNRQYRRTILYATEADGGVTSRFDKAALRGIADALGVTVSRLSTRELRWQIGRVVGFEYESPSDQIRGFTKPELMELAEYVVQGRHRGWL